MNKIDYNSSTNQDIKGKFVDREVIHCASNMVYNLTTQAENFPDYQDELYSAFEGVPDYEEIARKNGWTMVDDLNDQYKNGNFVNEDGEYSQADDWSELCDEQNIYIAYPDIFEHWIVTKYFGERLTAHGQKVFELFDFTIWARPTTGQAILLDGVIGEICEEMEILEGQKYDWSK
jgi:hypothetical protein